MTPTLISVIEALYASEINVQLSSIWDAGWTVKIGDELNGFDAEKNFDTLYNVSQWLINEVKRIYPQSEFANRF